MSKPVVVYNFSGYRLNTFIEYFDNAIERTDTGTSNTLSPGEKITFKLKFEGDIDSYEAYLNANWIINDQAFLCNINIIDSSLAGTQSTDKLYICMYNGGSTGTGCNPQTYLVGSEPSGYLIKNAIKYDSSCAETITLNYTLGMIPVDNNLGNLILDNFIEGKCSNLNVIPDPPDIPDPPTTTDDNDDGDDEDSSNQLTGRLLEIVIIIFIVIIIALFIFLIGGGIYFYKKISGNKKKDKKNE